MVQMNKIMGMGVLVVAAAACGPANKNARVNVYYDQVENFHTYALASDSSGSTGPGLNGMFVMYRITKIENTGSEAKSFVFKKGKIVTVTKDETVNEEAGADNILLSSQLLDNVTVGPGQTLTDANGLGCIIKVARMNDPKLLATTSSPVELMHTIDTSQPVSMKRIASDNGNALELETALPSSLQNVCGTN